MNKIKWFILPVLMIVSFVLISKPTYAFGEVYTYEELLDGVITPVPLEEYNEFRPYNPYGQGHSTLHGLAENIYNSGNADIYLINVKNVSSARLLIWDVDLDEEYYDDVDLGVIDYIEITTNQLRIASIDFIRMENGVPNYYASYTFDIWDYDFRLMVFERTDQQAYIDGQDDGYQAGLLDGAMKWINANQDLLNVEIDGVYYNITQYGQYMYDLGIQNGSEIMSNVQKLFEGVLSTIGNVFTITIFPGVTIGTLFMIPISFAMFKWFLKLIK